MIEYKGLAGEIGATGTTGLKGLTGPNGIAGIQGIRGVDGTHVITQAPCSVVCDAVICTESAITCIDNISATSFEPLPPLCSQEDVVCSSVNCHCA